MESKTYVFGNEGSTSNNGMLGLLAPLLQKQGVDPNVLLATQLNCTEGQIQNAISALTSQVQSVGNQVGMSGMQTINALQQGNMQIAQQIANCCCQTNNNITTQGYESKLAIKSSVVDHTGSAVTGAGLSSPTEALAYINKKSGTIRLLGFQQPTGG
jgi:hypothetical protein